MANRPKYRLFTQFAERVWRHLNLPPLTPIQVDVANYLQFGPAHELIEAFRGVGKSWLTAAFVVWLLYCDPQRRILIVSASKDYADTMSVFIKRLIDELDECAWLRPRGSQRNSMVQFDVGPALADKSPSVKSVGINGQITGSRADVIIADDVEVPKNSLTAVMREFLAERIKEFAYVIKPSEVDGVPVGEEKTPRIIFLGTPQTEMSLYNGLPAAGYAVRVWPARVPEKPELYRGNLAPFVMKMIEAGARTGTPTDPKRFSHADLLSRQMKVGKSAFQLQYQLDTTLSDALKYPLRLSDCIVLSLDPEKGPASLSWSKDPRTAYNDLPGVGFTGDGWYGPAFVDEAYAPYQDAVMAIDPSGRGTDETSYAVTKLLHSKVFLAASGGFGRTGETGYSKEVLTELALIAKKHRVTRIIVEENFGGGMFVVLLKQVLGAVYPCSVEEVHQNKAKEERIIGTLEPVLNSHKLVVDRQVIQDDLACPEPSYSLFYQLTRMTKEKGALAHDDRVDALEMAVKPFQEALEVNEEMAAEAFRQETIEDMLEGFLDGLAEALDGQDGVRRGAGAKNWHGA